MAPAITVAGAIVLVVLVIVLIVICCIADEFKCCKPRRQRNFDGTYMDGCCYSLGMKIKRLYFSCCGRLDTCGDWCNRKCRQTKTTKDSIADLEDIANHLIVLHSMDAMEEGNDVLNRDLESSVKLLIKNNREHFKPPSRMINPFFTDHDRCKAKIIEIMLEKQKKNQDNRIPDDSGEEGALKNGLTLLI